MKEAAAQTKEPTVIAVVPAILSLSLNYYSRYRAFSSSFSRSWLAFLALASSFCASM
jgi:hypothetical protein